MRLDALFRAFDAAMALRDAARRFKGEAPPPPDPATQLTQPPGAALVGQIETRLTNVVVAALKEAFDRDHARLELERAQLDEQRRRAEEAMRLEVRRQAVERELARLRLIAGAALVGWIAAIVLAVARVGVMSGVARGTSAVGWLLLLGALGAAFSAQGRLGSSVVDGNPRVDAGSGGSAALWLLIGGLAVVAIALLL